MKYIGFLLLLLVAVLVLVVRCHPNVEDRTRGVSENCEVHHSRMIKTNVPILYGLRVFTEWGKTLQSASSNNFPHAEEYILGGCEVGSYSPRQAIVYVCTNCLQVQQQWITQHPSPK